MSRRQVPVVGIGSWRRKQWADITVRLPPQNGICTSAYLGYPPTIGPALGRST